MIEITEENILSMVASSKTTTDEEYTERVWGNIESENPRFMKFAIHQLSSFENDETKNAFLEGVTFCYETIRRQIEAAEMS